MKHSFFIVGPTAAGKSEIAADVARKVGGEIVSADAFQIYRGLDILSGKPAAETLAKAPHHLIGAVSLLDDMNAESFRQLALCAIAEIRERQKLAVVVGGSGLYVKALTHGLADFPRAEPKLRAELNALSLEQLREKLLQLDSPATAKIDMKNRRRLIRAIEICLLSGKPVSAQRANTRWLASTKSATAGVFVYREREELYQRINRSVEQMFKRAVLEEVRVAGQISSTASQMIGLREIRQFLNGKMTEPECVAAIQQATRRYAKRQLTWFRRQTSFQALNLSLLSHQEAVEWISQKAPLAAAQAND